CSSDLHAARGGDGAERVVERPGFEEPRRPEPVEVAAGDVLEGVEEVEGRGVFVPPSTAVLAERAEERVLAQQAGERAQDQGGLVVARDAEGRGADGVLVAV